MTDRLALTDHWTLTDLDGDARLEVSLPVDVHTALIEAELLPDPYHRDNELVVDWVHRHRWHLETRFEVTREARTTRLLLDGVDGVAIATLNGTPLGTLDNAFRRFEFDVGPHLVRGENTLTIDFLVATDVANDRSAAYPLELPWLDWNSRIPNVNLLRKSACDAGWDWNIALMPLGILGGVELVHVDKVRLVDHRVRQRFDDDRVTVSVDVALDVVAPCRRRCALSVGGATVERDVDLQPGKRSVELSVTLTDPVRWWPAGLGEPFRHELVLQVGEERIEEPLALRELVLAQTPDERGSGFRFEVNGRPIMARGANWIPADALPGRRSDAVIEELLDSAVDAHMNMLRVWGGGRYETDAFYRACEARGLLVWQDFMFACNHYPAADPDWIASVRVEAGQQLRRLSRFGCIALWCGDNELVGALDWWEITRANRDRYLANYVRLNTALEEAHRAELGGGLAGEPGGEHGGKPTGVPFWPSSPSHGPLAYGDAWKSDARGDMHFWDVWHEAKPFSAYLEVQPRFCSEFGFQSFPSMPVIESFTDPGDRNVASPVMDVHQRNVGGNARIVETLVRHFRFPNSFERTVFLSQVQQALAIGTAIDAWRASDAPQANRCMGILYWQLNDTWPVASWSSLEYGGGWKLLHYAVRRLYASQRAMLVAEPSSERLHVHVVNDGAVDAVLDVETRRVMLDGSIDVIDRRTVMLAPDERQRLTSLEANTLPAAGFIEAILRDANGQELGRAEHWPTPYRLHDLPAPTITVERTADAVTLHTDRPAFHVTVDLGGRDVWSDNGITVLPGEPRVLRRLRSLAHPHVPMLDAPSLQHL